MVDHLSAFDLGLLRVQAQVDGWMIGDDGTLRPVPGRPFSTGQAGAGVQALTTFPAPSCSAQ
ncbi:MAG TPA: hypothetical protein VH024_05845 [Candidatus Angelobacter sp.]|nr:hypothetical protein [Candidatus Angelobacter sp.]